MGHKPRATAGCYRPRSGDAFRPHLAQIEVHILEQAGIVFDGRSQVQVQRGDRLLDGIGLDLQARQ